MESDEDNYEGSWRGVPGSILLINVHDKTNIHGALKAHAATCAMLKECLRTSNSYNVGVCLYGTDDGSSAYNVRSLIDIVPFSVPDLDNFLKLLKIDVSKYPLAAELRLSDALWHCNKVFANCKKMLTSRTVIILSKLDIPPVESDQKPTLKRVVDLVDSNIEIKVINISDSEYEIHQFYKDFIKEANKGKDVSLPKPVWDKQVIQQLLHQHAQRHLAVAQLNFELGHDFCIGVGIYGLLKSQSYNKKFNVDRETNAIVTSITKTTKITKSENEEGHNTQSGVELLKSELLHYQEYGGERIEFTDSEKKKIDNPFGPPMMKLLGFKPSNLLCKEKWFLKPCYFLYPNENLIDGSTKVFKALHKACIEMNMVAICVLCTRVNSKPTIVGLSPSSSPLNLDVEIGFDVISIPFAENLRQVPIEEDGDIEIGMSDSHKTSMKEVLQSLNFDYKPNMFTNPKLQCEYRAIEAIALQEEDMEPFTDTTVPDAGVFKTIKDDLFHNLFGPFAVNKLKRSVISKSSGSTNKKTKSDIDDSLLQNRLSNKTLALYTVSDLKNILKSRDIPDLPALTGLKKHELIELVYKYFK